MKRVLTYGTFDLLHFGHIEILRRAKELGDYLIVAVSTDEFNEIKGKKAYHNYETRKKMLEAIRYVDLVIPENDWKQKRNDVIDYKVDVVVMGSDWENNENFECLRDICEVIYLPRTEGISTTKIKKDLGLKEESNSNNSSYILKK
ncbi:MAG: glycerol-3-phosphate cytidylyltransferase [Clostridium sp. CAG_433_25_7]|nr:MAG: glycerol-3-phosphate cytidylyltransferase [Clostridium sp. CAG_433_25_7]